MNKDVKIVFLLTSALIMIGIVMIYSSSAVYAYTRYGDSLYFIKRHLLHLLIGLIALVACMAVSIEWLKKNARGIIFFSTVFLILALIPGIGRQAGGARRWIDLFIFNFQPSEIAKFAIIIYLAEFSSRKAYLLRNFRYGFLPAIFVITFIGGLVLIEPDMGTSVAIFFIGFVMLYIGGACIKHLLVISMSVIPVLAFAVISEPYRFKRILTFLNPWKEARGAGFQIIQSFIALGSGGLFGVGLGQSKQKLFYLPESYTDFMFSIIGEELGFFGAAAILILFSLLVWYIFRIAFNVKDVFASRAIFGMGVMIAFEIVVNIGVSIGLLPTKGLPLPFISYGGSSLLSHLMVMGLIFNMARKAE